MSDIKKPGKEVYDINWYADKYQSVLVWKNWLTFLVLLSLVGVMLMTALLFYIVPLKSVEPFVIQIDENTGVTEVVTGKNFKQYSTNEELIKYFSNKYVAARETYQVELIRHFTETVRVLSEPRVFSVYLQKVSPDNQSSPQARYGTHTQRAVTLTSFSLLKNDRRSGDSIVQIKVFVQEISSRGVLAEYFITATLTVRFNNSLRLTDRERLINPLGFQVLSYSTSKDIGKDR